MDKQDLIQSILRDAVQIYTEDGLVRRLESGKRLLIKLGADPSRPDLHLGHTVVLRRLRLFQELGHEIVFVIGDFTGMIGDPTGRSKTRPALTLEETRKSGESYFRQVTKVLDPDKTRIVYNSEWLADLRFADVIRLASSTTVARMLERDDFRTRFDGNVAIHLHELLYPLAQGYDSVALGADVEVGGTDQTFNLLVGRAMQSNEGQEPQEVITYPLLPGLDGVQKMSKSLDNYIGLDEPAAVQFEKAMRVPDSCLSQYFALTTDVHPDEAARIVRQDIREAHFLYARTITELYSGTRATEEAARRYRQVAAGAVPEHVVELQIPTDEAPARSIGLIELLRRSGVAASNSEARRSIQGRAVRVDGAVVEDVLCVIDLTSPVIVQVGKGRFYRVTLV
jgi:tyrosyl-tRNA synthetase